MITQIPSDLPLERQAGLAALASSHKVKKKKSNGRATSAATSARQKSFTGSQVKAKSKTSAEMTAYFSTGRKRKRAHKK